MKVVVDGVLVGETALTNRSFVTYCRLHRIYSTATTTSRRRGTEGGCNRPYSHIAQLLLATARIVSTQVRVQDQDAGRERVDGREGSHHSLALSLVKHASHLLNNNYKIKTPVEGEWVVGSTLCIRLIFTFTCDAMLALYYRTDGIFSTATA